MTDKQRSELQENIVKLYLRLNGYISTSLIIHSEEKRISAEIDTISIRFPYHSQDETEHNSSDFLEVPSNIDVIIGEVKSHKQQLQFNKALRQDNLISLTKILKWIGLFKEDQIKAIATDLLGLVTPIENSKKKEFTNLLIDTDFGKISLRTILFSPETNSKKTNSDKFVGWEEIDDFLWKCLCPENIREYCGIRYDFTAWGSDYSEIVKVYKNRQPSQTRFKNMEELYAEITSLRKS